MIGRSNFDFRSVLEAACAPLRENENGSKQNTNNKHRILRILSFIRTPDCNSGIHKCTATNDSWDWKLDDKLTANHEQSLLKKWTSRYKRTCFDYFDQQFEYVHIYAIWNGVVLSWSAGSTKVTHRRTSLTDRQRPDYIYTCRAAVLEMSMPGFSKTAMPYVSSVPGSINRISQREIKTTFIVKSILSLYLMCIHQNHLSRLRLQILGHSKANVHW